jgi:predicted dehydrogenase
VDDIAGLAIEFDPDAAIWRRDPARNPGGLLYDDGVHKYAVVMRWIGEIGTVQAMIGRTPDFLTEAPSAAIWRFKDKNCLGILDYTYAPHMIMRGKYVRVDEFFEIHGSRGVIWVTRCSGEMLDLPPVMVLKGTETISYQVPMDWSEGFHGAARDFIDGILQERQPELDAQTSKRILQVALAIYEASKTERPVAPESMT